MRIITTSLGPWIGNSGTRSRARQMRLNGTRYVNRLVCLVKTSDTLYPSVYSLYRHRLGAAFSSCWTIIISNAFPSRWSLSKGNRRYRILLLVNLIVRIYFIYRRLRDINRTTMASRLRELLCNKEATHGL